MNGHLHDLLLSGSGTAQVLDAAGSHPHAELCARACALAAAMAHDVERGDRVALVVENGSAFVVGLVAISLAGACALVVDPALPTAVRADILRSARVTAVVRGGRPPEDTGVPEFNADLTAPATVLPLSPRARDPDSPALILRTSGTSGQSRGVVLSHRAVLANVTAITTYLRTGAQDRFHIVKSMTHSSTLVGEVAVALATGGTIVALDPRVPPSRIARQIEAYGSTVLALNPTLLSLLVRGADPAALAGVHTVHVSGSVCDPSLLARARTWLPGARILNGYGLTEAGPRVSAHDLSASWKPGSVGAPLPGVEVEVRRADGLVCASGEIGEIFVRSPSLCLGYLAAVGVVPPTRVDGALRAGDRGYRDADGDIFLLGRADDLIVTAGHNVDPELVESRVRATGMVEDCLVFGSPDPLLGQRVVCAYIAAVAPITTELRSACAPVLPGHAVPQTFVAWADLPHGDGGKPSRRLAAERYNREETQ